MNRTQTALMAGLLLIAVAVSLTPTASAHPCAGPDCGDCDGDRNEVHIRTEAVDQSCANCGACSDFVPSRQ